MEIQKEREAFDEEFGVSEFNMFATGDENLDQSLVLKCNWLGWKARAELEYKENPDAIKISGLKTITKLCKFGADHNMEGCSFAEIVERMFDEVQQAQKVAVPEGFVLVPKEPTELFKEHLKNYLFDLWAGDHGCDWDGFVSVDAINHNNIWKMMIEVQEKGDV